MPTGTTPMRDLTPQQDAEQNFNTWLANQYGGEYAQHVQNQNSFNSIFDPNSPGADFTIHSNDINEATGRIEGLQRAKILTGQNPYQIGQDYQDAYGLVKKRSQLADTGSELLRASKAGAVADTRNALQSQGVKGGAAANAAAAVERQKSYDVNNQLVENQRKAEMDYMNAVKSNANFTTANEMNYGALASNQSFQQAPSYSNGFGTVICTELFRQGYYSKEIYELDQKYGQKLIKERPHVYEGYRFIADPIVRGMKKSKNFTRLVSLFALPWAYHMAYENNKFGACISFFGEIFCGIVGKIIGGTYANQEA